MHLLLTQGSKCSKKGNTVLSPVLKEEHFIILVQYSMLNFQSPYRNRYKLLKNSNGILFEA